MAGLALALVAVVLVLVGVAGSGPLGGVFHPSSPAPSGAASPISAAAHGGVVRVQIMAIPEGPPAPAFERPPRGDYSRPLRRIERFVPSPLPAPLDQGGCTIGGDLVVTFADGKQVTYGPCHRPASIDRLWAEIIYVLDPRCVPRCGPGGEPGP